jgi:hypothetical protein
MSSLFADFKQAQVVGSGSMLAATIVPVTPPQSQDRLRSFYYSSDSANILSDVRHGLLQDRVTGIKLPKQEGAAWVEIFVAFWKTIGEIFKIEEPPHRGTWTKVFEAWKEVANLLIRGYSSAGFQAWTVPCLYATGKYLRTFAIKADAETTQDPVAFSGGFQDDVVANFGKTTRLEEAARIINRMFTLCLSDRYGFIAWILSMYWASVSERD